jgi:GTP-binding protein
MGPEAGKRKVNAYLERLKQDWEELPPVFMTSSEDGRGRWEILDYIEQMNTLPIEIDEE